MNISDAVTYVRNMHNASNDSHWSDAEIYKLFEKKSNELLRVIGLNEDKDTSITTVSGTAAYAYPTDVVFIRGMWWNGRPLKQLNRRQYESRNPTGATITGDPKEYYLWEDSIILVPTPSSAQTVTVWCEKQQSAITSTASTLDIPAVLHGGVCDGVLAEMYIKDLNMQFARFFEEKWQQAKTEAREFVKQRRRAGGTQTVIDTDSSLETEMGLI